MLGQAVWLLLSVGMRVLVRLQVAFVLLRWSWGGRLCPLADSYQRGRKAWFVGCGIGASGGLWGLKYGGVWAWVASCCKIMF